jgi:hypothetical protein
MIVPVDSPLTSGRQVLMFRVKACIEFMPPLCRLPLSLLCQFTSKLIPSLERPLGFDSISLAFDTSSGVHLRSSPQYSPDSSWTAFSLIAHDLYSEQKPHWVVWFQLLVAETERPTLIFNTAWKAYALLHDTPLRATNSLAGRMSNA